MKYVSTEKKSEPLGFGEAIFVGMAPDGGLYVPESVPVFTKRELEELPGKSLHEVATITLHKWLHNDFDRSEIEKIVDEVLTFPLPLVDVGGYKVLELFHGPTYSFSDISSRFMSKMFEKILEKRKLPGKLIVATSGDSGSAVAHSHSKFGNSESIVVYPKGALSKVQHAQITRLDGKVLAIEVDGNFEDCQKLVNAAFHDKDLEKYNPISASSISIARLIPQIVIYVYLYSLLAPTNPTVVIPSGNFGNACTALLAKLMGVPIKKIVIACNKNDAAVDYAKTGVYKAKKTVSTLSNAMDIGDPHNFPRILHLCGYNHKQFLEFFDAFSISDSKVVHAIQAIWSEYEYMLDPHTAVAWAAADEVEEKPESTVIVATASPVKFAETIHKNTGLKVDNEDLLSELHKTQAKYESIGDDYDAFKTLLIREFEKSK